MKSAAVAEVSPSPPTSASQSAAGPEADNATEEAGYFEVAGGDLYTVLHRVSVPVARVLLIGHFAPERCVSYLALVRWARYLAQRGIEVLRFDYRGVGESTGVFEELSFSNWTEDVAVLAAWFQRRAPQVPFLLHGIGLGAMLAGQTFDRGIGDALLMWAPPASAREVLRSVLMNWVMLQKLSTRAEERKPLQAYLDQLDTVGSLEVHGYTWSAALWRDSIDFELPVALRDAATASATYNRPVRSVHLGLEAAPLVRGSIAGYEDTKDLKWLFDPNFNWLCSVLHLPGRTIDEADSCNAKFVHT